MEQKCGSPIHEGTGFFFHLWCSVPGCEWEKWVDHEPDALRLMEEHGEGHSRNDGSGPQGCGPWS